jgi:hypothetical protein
MSTLYRTVEGADGTGGVSRLGPGAGSTAPEQVPGAQASGSNGAAALRTDTVVLLLADIAPAWRAWGWWRIARGAQGLGGVPGLRWGRVLGSGHDGGFGLQPSASRQGMFAVFRDEGAADAFIRQSPLLQRLQERSREWALLKLQAWQVRGQWGGQSLACAAQPPAPALPVAALTRASVRPSRAAAFWRHAPLSQADLAAATGCRLAVGLGEAPVLRQATFSLWESVAAMDAYARSGAHLAAIRAAGREDYFSESMFVRFVPRLLLGRWKGQPLG